MKKLTTQTIIERAIKVHGTKYDYTHTKYVNRRTNMTITCKIHGNFSQNPGHHLQGHGCMKCKNTQMRKIQTKGIEYFSKLLESKFPGQFAYTLTDYKGMTHPMEFTCKVHGKFTTKPTLLVHHNVKGCPHCGPSTVVRTARTNVMKLVETLKITHNDAYDYSKLQFTRMKNKHTIICKIHGEFQQELTLHKAGRGCPSCSISGFDPKKPAYLYYLSINHGQAYKIGITNRSVNERFTATELSSIKVVKLWEYTDGYECRKQEQDILKTYKLYKYTGISLLESGNSELFTHDVLNLDTEV